MNELMVVWEVRKQPFRQRCQVSRLVRKFWETKGIKMKDNERAGSAVKKFRNRKLMEEFSIKLTI